MKKTLALILAVVMVLAMMAGCGSSNKTEPAATEAPKATEAPAATEAPKATEAPAEPEPEPDHYPVTIENVNFELEKTEFTYEKAPERVITFWDNSLEIMLALGLGDRIIMAVGANPEGLLPELKEEYDKIAGGLEFYNSFLDSNAALSKESAIMMEPDFILAWKSSFNEKTLGDTTYWNENNVGTYIALNSNNVSEYRTLENEYTDILNIGKIFNVEDRANEIVNELKSEVERVTSSTAGQEKKTCLVFEFLGGNIWNYDKTMLAGNMVMAMGGDLLDAPSDVGKEDIINLDPEVIFVIGDTEESAKAVLEDPAFASMKAVQSGSVFNLPLSYVYTSGVRTILGLNAIGAGLYPELYASDKADAESDSDHYPVTIENVNFELEKTEFTYEKAPERVITFWDNSLETMLALGLGDRIIMAVGANPEGLLPELKEEYDKIAGGLEFYNDFLDTNAALSKESAIMMEPDFILAWKSSFSDKTIGDTTYWNEKGVGTYIALNSNNVSEYRTLENEYTDILNIGKIFDVEDRANEIVDQLKSEVERVTSATKDQPKQTCMIFEYHGDSAWNNNETMLGGNMVKAMGGDLLDAPIDVGKEDIINLDPEVIFIISDTEDGASVITDDPGFASLRAVQNHRVYTIPLSYCYTSGVRTILGLNTIGAGLYPDLYSE